MKFTPSAPWFTVPPDLGATTCLLIDKAYSKSICRPMGVDHERVRCPAGKTDLTERSECGRSCGPARLWPRSRSVAFVHRRTVDLAGSIVPIHLFQVAQGAASAAATRHARANLLPPRHLQGSPTSPPRHSPPR